MTCKRCGTCCRKGGPALHLEDRRLVDEGTLPANCLFTIRRGELVRDNVKDTLNPMAGEAIKIKGKPGGWICLFYDGESRGCTIYKHRPLECRALDCQDTQRIQAIYETDRLSRKDLLSTIEGLWDLVTDHEDRCGYGRLRALVGEGIVDQTLKREAEILEIMRYDTHLRQLTVQNGGLDAGMLDFIFGRPLSETIKMFRLKLIRENEQYRLVPAANFSRPSYSSKSEKTGGRR